MLSKTESKRIDINSTSQTIRNILVFHKITNRLTFGSTNYSPERFLTLLKRLLNGGYQLTSLDTVLTWPDTNQVSVTFDDGYSHLMKVLPILIEELGVIPTVFIPTAYIGRENRWDYSSYFRTERHLNVEEIKELAKMGVSFGSHGHSHIDLTGCDSNKLREELCISKEILEDLTGQVVTAISYPFGRSNHHVIEMSENLGFQTGLTMKFPKIADTKLTCGRIPVYFFDNHNFVRQKLQNGLMRSMHGALGSVINGLSYGTVILNRITGRISVNGQ